MDEEGKEDCGRLDAPCEDGDELSVERIAFGSVVGEELSELPCPPFVVASPSQP